MALLHESPRPPETVQDELQGLLAAAVASGDIPGAVMEVVTPHWRWASAAGKGQVTPTVPARPDMHFHAASIAKIFTAAAVCRLAEEGRLALHDPVEIWLHRRYLDRLNDYRRITLALLLSHRSGIADYDERAIMALQQSETPLVVTADFAILQGLERGPLHSPDGGHAYSNVNYLLLALVIDAASETSYEEYLRRAIIDPLGLTHTSLTADGAGCGLPDPFMASLSRDHGQWTDYSRYCDLYSRGAGAMRSTVGDLNTFHQALREGGIIGRAAFAEMEAFLPGSDRYAYGLGYMRKRDDRLKVTLLGHSGTYPGSCTNLYYCPEAETYFAFNVNGNSADILSGGITRYLGWSL
jgi:D-alanyl-D-alanine carboxypeptidase